MNRLAPSILSADFSKLGAEVAEIEDGGAHIIHVDIMDGHFVPNISYGASVMKSLVGKTKLPFDVHLMIEKPERYIEDFVTENTEIITVHAEACTHLHRTVQLIHSFGVKAGIALNPATPPAVLDYILEEIDLVLVMSVNPGFGGQKFIPSALQKAKELQKLKMKYHQNLMLEIDGGITLENVKSVLDCGIELVVAGSSVFGAENRKQRIQQFLEQMK